MDPNLVRRVSFAVVAIPLALAIIWLGGWPLVALVSMVSVLGTRELYDMAARQGVQPSRVLGLGTAALFPPVVYLAVTSPAAALALARWWPYAGALWLIVLLTWLLMSRSPDQRPLGAVAITVVGALYSGALPGFLIDIRHHAHGTQSWPATWLVFFPLVVTWICDTAAMFGGRMIGGPKLAPVVSPGKTRAGAVAGFVGGIAVAPVFNALALAPTGVRLSLGQVLLFAGVLTLVGQVGDLAESLFKREAGIKDSSNLIPGHGGVLDRFDSLYFVVPSAALMYRVFLG
jgi:phosphatidate cytidylyltransferase